MSLFREIPPTAGLPLYAKEAFSALLRKGGAGSLEEDFRNYLGLPYAAVTYSGTAAFYIILETLKDLSPKKTVVIPSFICPLVPLAVARAGLKALVCDINKDDFSFQAEELQRICSNNPDILAVVAAHLAGIPQDLSVLQKTAREKKIFLVEDCAQSLGASYRGKKTGASGDLAFFSLCRGKGLTIYEGGALTAKAEFAPLIEKTIQRIVKPAPLSEALKITELYGYWLFYRPLLFWCVFRLPQLFWQAQGKIEKAFIEYFDVNFPLHQVSRLRKDMGHAMFSRLEEGIAGQRRTASIYINGLRGIPGIKLITEPEEGVANYPYLTLLFDDPEKRCQAFHGLAGSGLGISQIYLSAVTDYAYLKDLGAAECPHARQIAARHITLSTSSYLTEKETLAIIAKIKKI